MIEVRHYATESGRDVVSEWLVDLGDIRARAKVSVRITRLEAGNFGDCKPIGEGVWELRIDWGPGYRVYYSVIGKTVVLLLCGGDKRTQSTDTKRAIKYLKDYKKRTTKS